MAGSVGEDFPLQVRRVQKLREQYLEIGAAGRPGALILQDVLDRAAAAQSSGDIVQILRLYGELTECE